MINSWNNWYEGSYLEPDKKNGFANLNALSKALFDLPFKKQNYNLTNLKKKLILQFKFIFFMKI